MRKMWSKLLEGIHQSYFLVILCVGIIAGMIVGLVFRINYFGSPMWLVFVGLIVIIVYFRPRLLFVGIALIAGGVLAFYRVAEELIDQDYIKQFYGQTVKVSGIVSGDPETDEKATKVKLANLIFGDDNSEARKGSIFVSLRQNEEIQRGDKLILEGKIDNGFGTYVGYMYQPKVVKLLKPEPKDFILAVRDGFAERVKNLISEPEVNLGLSYLLGMKTNLPEELSTNLRLVGLVHIVVASGTHLSILVEIAKKLFGRISRFAGLLFSGLFIVLFMAMVGFTPSIMRAGIMAILTLVAWYVGRKFAPWRIILIVAAGTLLLNPNYLVDLGWLLSFASYAGIMMLGPRLTRYFYDEKKPGFIGATILTTISATLMTLPITLYFFGTVSLISVLANLLILPTLPYAMGLVFLTGAFAGVPIVGEAVAFLATKLLDFHIFIVQMFAEMRSFLIEIPTENWKVFLIYGLILGILVVAKIFWKKKVVV